MKRHSTKRPSLPRRIFYRLLIGIGVVIGIHLILQYLNLNVYHQQHGFVYEFSNRFDLDDEVSAPTWLSSMLFAAISVSCFIAARLEHPKRRFWSILGVLAAVMSIDEVSTLHEFVLESLHNFFYTGAAPELGKNAWVLVLPWLLAATVWLALYTWRQLPRRTFVLCALGGAVLLCGAILVDIVASSITTTPFMHQGVLVGIEEAAEFIGTSIVLCAIISYILNTHEKTITQLKHILPKE